MLGALLVREDDAGRRAGRIVEVEAYDGPEDAASHARFGRTGRNAVMFGPPGVAYVYLVYGMYECLNVVAEPDGRPAAVLVRAVEPVEGIDLVREARRTDRRTRGSLERIVRLPAERLASGPGLVCVAFSIGRGDNGADLCDAASPLRLEAPPTVPERVAEGPRVGIGYAGEPWLSLPWRLWLPDSAAVSGPKGGRR